MIWLGRCIMRHREKFAGLMTMGMASVGYHVTYVPDPKAMHELRLCGLLGADVDLERITKLGKLLEDHPDDVQTALAEFRTENPDEFDRLLCLAMVSPPIIPHALMEALEPIAQECFGKQPVPIVRSMINLAVEAAQAGYRTMSFPTHAEFTLRYGVVPDIAFRYLANPKAKRLAYLLTADAECTIAWPEICGVVAMKDGVLGHNLAAACLAELPTDPPYLALRLIDPAGAALASLLHGVLQEQAGERRGEGGFDCCVCHEPVEARHVCCTRPQEPHGTCITCAFRAGSFPRCMLCGTESLEVRMGTHAS
jgi:hypothetical protein